MKVNVLIVFFSLFALALTAQVDKKAITSDFIKGHEKDVKELEELKQYFSPNIKFTWHNGGTWPDGSDGSLEQFWKAYTVDWRNYKYKMTDLVVRELGNETYIFYTWESTPITDEQHPDWTGTAISPAACRFIWENDKIKHIYFYADMKTREAQHAAQNKK